MATEKVDAQAWHNGSPRIVLSPVGGKGIVVHAVEVHHREEHVHPSLAEPSLRVLRHRIAGIPAKRGVAREVGVFAHGRATHFHPRPHGFHGIVHGLDAAVYVGSAPGLFVTAVAIKAVGAVVVEGYARLGVTNVVEVNAVHVVGADNFATDVRQIVRGAGHTGVHHPGIAALLAEFGMHAWQCRRAQLLRRSHLANGKCHHPGMAFHAAAVTFVDGETQRVVVRPASRGAREGSVPGLDGRGIGCGRAHPGLKEHGVDAQALQAVEHVAEFAALLRHARGSGCLVARPVEAPERRNPHGANLVYYLRRSG